MYIFIAGCARSGTSVVRGLMECFKGVYAHGGYTSEEEEHATAFEQVAGWWRFTRWRRHLVLKRKNTSHLTLPDLRPDVELLYCVRHPLDVLTSSHPRTKHERPFHVTPERWRSEYDSWRRFREKQPQRRAFVLRYESLINDPDSVQQQIAQHFGLVPKASFTDNPSKVLLSSNSLMRWQRDRSLVPYFDSFSESLAASIRAFCHEFGYELPPWFKSGAV
jgi:hypothetical protein